MNENKEGTLLQETNSDILKKEQEISSICDEKHNSEETIECLDDEEVDEQYYIVSSDGDKFQISKREIEISGFLTTAFSEKSDIEREITLHEISIETYCEIYEVSFNKSSSTR